MTGSRCSTVVRRSRSSWSTTPTISQPSRPKGNRVMTQQAATEQEYLIPDEIARAAVLPGSYTDEEGTVFPAYAWLRANNPLGLAKLGGFDPIWLVTKHADIMAIERNPALDRKSTRLNSSHPSISYAVFCLQEQIREAAVLLLVDPGVRKPPAALSARAR